MTTIIHADDFGITPEQSRLILDCSTACGGDGALNSLSILANSPRFGECADMLDPFADNLHISLHVNVVEGPSCADSQRIPLLTDEAGLFRQSFAQMLKISRGADAEALRQQLEIEIGAQLDAYLQRFPQMRGALRIDSHQHFHLIPAVFDSLLAAAQKRGCTIEFLRIPAEPLLPFAQAPSVWLKTPPINWVKHWLLNYLWRQDRAQFPEYPKRSAVFCGINFSGHMTRDRVSAVLPHLQRYADGKDMQLELLFHPGGYDDPACALNPALTGFVDFYTSPLRHAEAETVKALDGVLI